MHAIENLIKDIIWFCEDHPAFILFIIMILIAVTLVAMYLYNLYKSESIKLLYTYLPIGSSADNISQMLLYKPRQEYHSGYIYLYYDFRVMLKSCYYCFIVDITTNSIVDKQCKL